MKLLCKLSEAILVVGISSPLFADDCGMPGTIGGEIEKIDATGKGYTEKVPLKARYFDDGSIAVRARLSVNPDGGTASYTVGDHGFTYIANGLSPWPNKKHLKCDLNCSKDFLEAEAEAKSFAVDTKEFCVYAMEVEPVTPGEKKISCEDGRYVIGNGKGRPKLGVMLDTVAGKQLLSYVSTTSIQHRVKKIAQHLDSESLPIAVTPNEKLLGKIVWVGGAGFSSAYALIGDTGPAFGEGSIALHQLLRTGKVSKQKLGPISVADRCGPEERGLRPPFQSRPDLSNDHCRPDYTVKKQTDIRAYTGISRELDYVILGQAKFLMEESLIKDTVSVDSIKAKVVSAGYTQEKINKMLACLPK
ncbi:hypothetical protein [Pseudomonas nunensis]|uniref:hypothetical protein n=1 Tax=Pseudomonas nunensis TaxID=2961896 RepID=UPI0006B6686D|nr:hypothetical protein [Pseudomonas nunensis]KOX98507.1 hypothetical protein AM274_30490 [Pseudomonas nunensis]